MNIIVFLIVGVIGGWIASTLIEGHGLGAAGDLLLGVVGAFVGGYFFDFFGLVPPYGFWSTLVTSVIGSFIVLMLAALFRRASGSGKLGKL